MIVGGLTARSNDTLFTERMACHKTETFHHDTKSLQGFICQPEGKGNAPVMMLIHGGGFTGGNRYKFDSSLITHYLDLGFAVVSVEYRLVSEGGSHPEAIKDCMHNLHWIKDHAKEYQFDTSRIVLQGSSAGSYLAMMLALSFDSKMFQPDFGPYQNHNTRIKAVISSAAMYDWKAISKGTHYTGKFRCDPKASPVHWASEAACMHYLLLGGDSDKDWSPPESARRMQESLQQSGKVCELHLKNNQKHPGLYDVDKPYTKWALPIIDTFLEKYVLSR